MARLPKLREFAAENSLKIVSIADLIRFRVLLSFCVLFLKLSESIKLHMVCVMVLQISKEER